LAYPTGEQMVTYGTEETKREIAKTVMGILEEQIKKLDIKIEEMKYKIEKARETLEEIKRMKKGV
jgi:hypothetical protein